MKFFFVIKKKKGKEKREKEREKFFFNYKIITFIFVFSTKPIDIEFKIVHKTKTRLFYTAFNIAFPPLVYRERGSVILRVVGY